MLQFKLQQVWILVDLTFGKKAIGTKWVFRNKRDERSIVARIEAIRLFLAFALYMGFLVYQMDVKSAFLHATIEEEVYVYQPPGFVDPAHPNKVYKVVKDLYGLHQAPRAWYETLSSFLLEKDFRRVYMDDIISGSTIKSMCTEFEEVMHKRFQISSMGELEFFLGLQVKQQPDGISISQDKYVANILKKFDFCSIKTSTTPIESNKPLVKDKDGAEVDVHKYRSLIGSLMYLTAMFVVCACARFQVTPKASHLHAVKRIFRYLKHQPKLMLWKQTIMANNTTKAEYVATAHCCGQVLWIQNQMMDYGFKFMNTKIHIDNESTICVVKNPVYHSRTKHIEIRHHFIRDCYEKRLIDVLKIHTDSNVANLLTKGFDVPRISIDLRMDRSSPGKYNSSMVSNFNWQMLQEYIIDAEIYVGLATLGSYEAPLPEGHTSGSAEDSMQLKDLLVLGEESEDQGRNQDINDDPLVSLVRESMKEKSIDFVTPTKASGEAQEEEISPTILEAAKTLSKVASQGVSKEKSTDKGKRYRRRARSMAKKIDTGLDAEEEVNTGREEINTGIEEVSTGSTKIDYGTAGKRGQREGKAPMVEEDIQATHKTKEQIETRGSWIGRGYKKQQKKIKAQVQFEAQFYTEEDWDAIKAKLEANAELTKDVLGKDLPEQDFAKRMAEMVNQRKKHFAEERAKAKRNKPMTQSQLRIYMSNYLKNQGTWKLSQLKKLKFEEIKEEFDKLVQQIDTFVPINLEATKAKLKRYGEELQTKTSKKQRFDDKDVPAIGDKVAEVKEEEPVKRTGKRKKQKARKGVNVDKSAQEDSETDKEESVEAMNPTPLTTKSDSVVN
ncbi:putative ribonuclease H-like domain-containing protein [Tanacetum coccineum]